jgi:hypothetical protein
MLEFAHEDGGFTVKKQNAKDIYPDLVTTPEVFLGNWEQMAPYRDGNFSETPMGYFLFIDGKFRWDSTLQWVMLG